MKHIGEILPRVLEKIQKRMEEHEEIVTLKKNVCKMIDDYWSQKCENEDYKA